MRALASDLRKKVLFLAGDTEKQEDDDSGLSGPTSPKAEEI